MLTTYRDPITGELHKIYDDEPPDYFEDDYDEESEKEVDDPGLGIDSYISPYLYQRYEQELDRYYEWLYGDRL